MGLGRNRLTAREVDGLTKPGRYGDGDGLYLVVARDGSRKWVYRYSRGARGAAKVVDLGLGAVATTSLRTAREKADACRQAIARGEDPKAARAPAASKTFGACADDFIAAREDGWRNAKHVAQWRMTLGDTYCRTLRARPVRDVSTDDVLAVLRPIWSAKPETASRIRGRIERVLDAAKVANHRSGDNPARWRGHLDMILPKSATLSRGHHAALPWMEMPDFMARLRSRDGLSARCLEFTILTAARTIEAIAARWEEVRGDLWIVPPERMKGGREHRVPLSPRALAVIAPLRELGSEWIFPGDVDGAHLSNMAMLNLISADRLTVHGFRSTFRDWVSDATDFPEELAEIALAHTIRSKTERAYRRRDALAKRRQMMVAWERYCLGATAPVPITLAAAR